MLVSLLHLRLLAEHREAGQAGTQLQEGTELRPKRGKKTARQTKEDWVRSLGFVCCGPAFRLSLAACSLGVPHKEKHYRGYKAKIKEVIRLEGEILQGIYRLDPLIAKRNALQQV